jgi:hypothetical protein
VMLTCGKNCARVTPIEHWLQSSSSLLPEYRADVPTTETGGGENLMGVRQ